ncbi:hypothetical protein V5O48_002926 [Marasmius crinis-equi]|uniref:Zn(2)-C6 fungal-type domain-containing protein n=1 Tax=Marasmius crinis-equi TaxID=585013 RepID=A0ABR3FUE3_9AGAR
MSFMNSQQLVGEVGFTQYPYSGHQSDLSYSERHFTEGSAFYEEPVNRRHHYHPYAMNHHPRSSLYSVNDLGQSPPSTVNYQPDYQDYQGWSQRNMHTYYDYPTDVHHQSIPRYAPGMPSPKRDNAPSPLHHTANSGFQLTSSASDYMSGNTQRSPSLAGSLDPATGIFYRTPEHPRLRTAQACEKCRTRKAKCSGEHPSCKRCLTRGLVCQYAKEGRVRGPNKPKPKALSLVDGGVPRDSARIDASSSRSLPQDRSVAGESTPSGTLPSHSIMSSSTTPPISPMSTASMQSPTTPLSLDGGLTYPNFVANHRSSKYLSPVLQSAYSAQVLRQEPRSGANSPRYDCSSQSQISLGAPTASSESQQSPHESLQYPDSLSAMACENISQSPSSSSYSNSPTLGASVDALGPISSGSYIVDHPSHALPSYEPQSHFETAMNPANCPQGAYSDM